LGYWTWCAAEVVVTKIPDVLLVFPIGEEGGILLDHAVDDDDLRLVESRALSSSLVPFSRRQKSR
jgi:hypothetical protein